MESSIKSTFQEHQMEIQRRSSLLNSDTLNPTTFSRVEDDTADDPFQNPEQQFVVFSLSHKEFAPRPEKVENPALCIFGLFETLTEAHAHARIVQTNHPEISVLVDRTHKWIVAASTLEHLTNQDYITTHVSTLLQKHADIKKQNDTAFQEMVDRKEAGKVSTAESKADQKNDASETRGSRFKIAQHCRVHDQKLVVVSFVLDEAEAPEFLFQVFAAFETDAQVNRYVRNVCGTKIIDHHIDVVQNGAWLFPQAMQTEKAQREVYRSDELNKVMTTHRKNPQEVEKFMKDNEEQLKEWDVLSKDEVAEKNDTPGETRTPDP